MAEPVLNERQFPNEIFSLIIGKLDDDKIALRNTALVCRDFAQISRSLIFREIDLRTIVVYGREQPRKRKEDLFSELLHDPRSVHIGEFVRTLHAVGSGDPTLLDFILENLPSLINFRIPSPTTSMFQVIQTHLGNRLIDLCIERVSFGIEPETFQPFRDMLESMECLKILTLIRLTSLSDLIPDRPFMLPRSLETLRLRYIRVGVWNGICSGMEVSFRPPSLKTLIIDDGDAAVVDRSFWESVGLDMQVVWEVHHNIINVADGRGKLLQRILHHVLFTDNLTRYLGNDETEKAFDLQHSDDWRNQGSLEHPM